MTRTLTVCVAVLMAIGLPSTKAADAAPRRMFAVTLSIVEDKDGRPRTLAEPTLVVKDGDESTFLAGAELPVDADKKRVVEVGTHACMTVTQKADKLQVALRVGYDDVTDRNDEGFTVRQSGAECVKKVRPGETFVVDMGQGRQAKVTVLTIGVSQVASAKD